MERNPRTYDGKPVSAAVSGFKLYSTERVEVPEAPIPVLTPQDLFDQLKELRGSLNLADLKRAIKLLYTHVHDTHNPHNFTLDDLDTDLTDYLYGLYANAGGKASKTEYLAALVTPFELASSVDPNEQDQKKLVSVAQLVQYIESHDQDIHAHKPIMDRVFPGSPIRTPTTCSVQPGMGINQEFTDVVLPTGVSYYAYLQKQSLYKTSPYSFIGADGSLHFHTDAHSLPCDYSTGYPAIPCFSTRHNYLSNSNDFSIFTGQDIKVQQSYADVGPDGVSPCISLSTIKERGAKFHRLVGQLPKIEEDTSTFSVFAKAGASKCLAITVEVDNAGYEVVGVFNLTDGNSFIVNQHDRYKVTCVALARGWYRCAISMYRQTKTAPKITLQFISSSDTAVDLKYIAKGNTEGLLWGLQYENGYTLSPYIRTEGKPGVRLPLSYALPISALSNWTANNQTIAVKYQNPGTIPNDVVRPVMTIENSDGSTAATISLDSENALRIIRYTTMNSREGKVGIPVTMDRFKDQGTSWVQFVHAATLGSARNTYNRTVSEALIGYPEWDAGAYIRIGSDHSGRFLEGYFGELTVYPCKATAKESIFLNGEIR